LRRFEISSGPALASAIKSLKDKQILDEGTKRGRVVFDEGTKRGRVVLDEGTKRGRVVFDDPLFAIRLRTEFIP